MGKGSGETVYKIKVGTGASVSALDTLTTAAAQAQNALRALSKMGGGEAIAALTALQKQSTAATLANNAAKSAAAQLATSQTAALKAETAARAEATRATESGARVAKLAAQTKKEEHLATIAGARAAREQAKAASEAGGAAGGFAGAVEQLGGSLKGAYGQTKSFAQGLISVAQQAMGAAQAVYSFAQEGQKLKGMDIAFKTLGGNAMEMERLRKATGGVVDDATLKRVYNLGSLFELPQDKINDLIRLAKGASVALGTTTGKALEDTFTAASRQSKMIADNMGIVIGDMRQMYEEYARKIGKSVDTLTDKEKQRAFILRMIEKGGRQVELAGAAMDNAFAASEAQYTNWINTLKLGAAEMFVQSGMMDKMGEAFEFVQQMVNGNETALGGLIAGAFTGIMNFLPQIVGLFGSLLPLLQPLGQAFTVVGGVAQALTPILGLLATVVSGVLSLIIDLVAMAMEPLLRSAAAVASLFDDKLARALRGAADKMAEARVYIDANTRALKENKDAAAAAADAHGGLGGAVEAKGLELDFLNTGLGQDQAKAAAAFVQADIQMMSRLAQAEVDKFGEAAAGGMKGAAKKMALAFAEQGGLEKDKYGLYSSAQLNALAAAFEATSGKIMTNKKKADADLLAQSRSSLNGMRDLYNDYQSFGMTQIADSALEGSKTQIEALQKLEVEYEKYAQAMATAGLEGAALEIWQGRLNDMFAQAGEQIAAHFDKKKDKKKGSGKSAGIDYMRGEYEAQLALMSDYERQRMETQTKYDEMANKLRLNDADNRIALTTKMYEDLDKLEREAGEARQRAQFDLSLYFMSESEAEFATRLQAVRDQADAMRKIAKEAGASNDDMERINSREKELLAAEKPATKNPFGKMMGAGQRAIGEYRRYTAQALLDAEAKAKAHTEKMAALFQNMGTSIGSTLVAISVGGEDMRDNMFKLMGQLFGQLSTAFLAWANTEIAMFSGNPFAGAAAAIALGVVASTISAFGTRKPASGGGASGQAARRMDEDRAKGRGERGGDTIYMYGFATPDSISGSVKRGNMRGKELDGRNAA